VGHRQQFIDVSALPEISMLGSSANNRNLDHDAWHGYIDGEQGPGCGHSVRVYPSGTTILS
jgi:hypothetical protein